MIIRNPPTWFRLLQIGIGALSIILSMLAIAYPGLAAFSVIVLISIILLIIGIERVVIGMLSYSRPYSNEQSVTSSLFSAFFIGRRSSPFANIGLGIVAIALAIVALAFPLIATGVLVALISFGLHDAGSFNYKALTIGVGILSIVLAVIIIASPALGIFFITLVLSIALLINGIEMIILGITGKRSGNVLP
ncbi:MAG TPA: DUF308 domain-containing protein [Nitrososphaeraceae archaeon]|nr:DUF308 domain-containing protein [Nitrososphaeraceae archaeon]